VAKKPIAVSAANASTSDKRFIRCLLKNTRLRDLRRASV
jgi:hypothetical protein